MHLAKQLIGKSSRSRVQRTWAGLAVALEVNWVRCRCTMLWCSKYSFSSCFGDRGSFTKLCRLKRAPLFNRSIDSLLNESCTNPLATLALDVAGRRLRPLWQCWARVPSSWQNKSNKKTCQNKIRDPEWLPIPPIMFHLWYRNITQEKLQNIVFALRKNDDLKSKIFSRTCGGADRLKDAIVWLWLSRGVVWWSDSARVIRKSGSIFSHSIAISTSL